MSNAKDKPVSDESELPELGARLSWVDKPQNVSMLIKCLVGFCVLLFVLDFIVHRHAWFSLEQWYNFYSIAGFVAFTCIVLGAKNLRRLIGRAENYYAPYAVDAEDYPAEGLQRQTHGQQEAQAGSQDSSTNEGQQA